MRTRLRGRRVFLWIYVGEWLDRFVLWLFRRGIIYSFCSYIYLGSNSLCFLCSFMIFSRYTKKASSAFLVGDPKSLLGIIYSLCSYIYLGSNSLCFLCSFMIFSRYTKKVSSVFLVGEPKSLLGIIYSLCSYIYLGSNSLCFLCSFMIFSRYTKKASSAFLVGDPKSLLGIIYSLCSYIYLGSNSLCFEEPKQKSLRPSPSGREGETHRARQCVSVETHIMTLHLL